MHRRKLSMQSLLEFEARSQGERSTILASLVPHDHVRKPRHFRKLL